MKNLQNTVAAIVLIATFYAASAKAGIIFSDDFNRPDSPSVDNGWIDSSDNINGNFQIVNDEAIKLESGNSTGMYRPIDFVDGLNIQATIKEGGGHSSVPDGNAFNAGFLILNNTGSHNTYDGFGFQVGRSDSVFNDSAIYRLDGSTLVDIIYAPFQFQHELVIDTTIMLDGSIFGTISEGLNSFTFSFGTYAIQSVGSNFLFKNTGANGTRPPGSLRERLDDITLSSIGTTEVPVPTTLPLLGLGLAVLGYSRRKRKQHA